MSLLQGSNDGIFYGITITIDSASRIVIPKALRDALGLREGVPLSVTSDGIGVRIELVREGGRVVDRDGHLVVESSSGRQVTDEEIRQAMDAGRR